MNKALNFGLGGTIAIGGVSWFVCLKELRGAVTSDLRSSFVLYVMIFSLAIQLPRIFGLRQRWIQILEIVTVLSAGFLAGALLASSEGLRGLIFPAIYVSSNISFLLMIRARAKQPGSELVA
jgi:uncharacterized membrane protein YoaK (UPF0700 family)